MNIILLAKTRKVRARKSNVINHGNHHSPVNNIVDVSKLIELLIQNSILKKQLGQICEIETLNFFAQGTVKIATGIFLHKY